MAYILDILYFDNESSRVQLSVNVINFAALQLSDIDKLTLIKEEGVTKFYLFKGSHAEYRNFARNCFYCCCSLNIVTPRVLWYAFDKVITDSEAARVALFEEVTILKLLGTEIEPSCEPHFTEYINYRNYEETYVQMSMDQKIESDIVQKSSQIYYDHLWSSEIVQWEKTMRDF